MMELTDSVTAIKGIGEKTAGLFGKLGIFTVNDLLDHFPRSYDAFRLPVRISELRDNCVGAVECVVQGAPSVIRRGGRLIVSLRLNDGSGSLSLSWFNAPFITKAIKVGTRYIFRGMISSYRGTKRMTQPGIFTREEYVRRMKELQPVYPLTAGISNAMMMKTVRLACGCISEMKDYLTPKQAQKLGLYTLSRAVSGIHFPIDEEDAACARRRLAFDDFFTFLAAGRIMKRTQELIRNAHPVTDNSFSRELERSLPYKLTGAQKRVLDEIRHDMASDGVSTRLVQGDVGCGKTIVAVMALLDTVKSGYQGCMLAPTDVLASQHYHDIASLLEPFGVRVTLLTGRLSASEKREALAAIESHETDIVVGTHAIIQKNVRFACLGMAVIDEQHRLGVRQREMMHEKGEEPYILVMSATPIPRSLAIILYGDMKLSVIDEMPADRLPVKNCVIGEAMRDTAYNFIRSRVSEGRQAYVICPMIEESEELDAQNVSDHSEHLRELFAPDHITVAALHGRMAKDEKEKVLSDFYEGRTDILVSTTVVEVGVNVPNATVMMVENAERYGLAQLHQLRGRVGRGAYQSYCIFVKGTESDECNERLDILTKYNDGLMVAQKDLEMRGPGQIFGVRQSGEAGFRAADMIADADLLKLATQLIDSLPDDQLDRMIDSAPGLFKALDYLGDVL